MQLGKGGGAHSGAEVMRVGVHSAVEVKGRGSQCS